MKTRSKTLVYESNHDMIRSVSFIVVARNEAFGMEKCLQSLVSMPLEDCEIICVDSDSTDETLEVMKRYAAQCVMIQIYQCKGYVNSAIARNVGLKCATKCFYFFVDGDVELNEKFIHTAMEYLLLGKADMVSGQLSEIYYESGYQSESRRVGDRYHIREEKRMYFAGGIFIARSSLVLKAGNWDERMVRNQDIDFTLRLSRNGYLLAIPVIMGIHHTKTYNERTWLFVKKLYPMFLGMLIRKNIDRPFVIIKLLRRYRGVLFSFVYAVLVCIFIFVLISGVFDFHIIMVGLLGLFLFDISRGVIKGKHLLSLFVLHYIYPYLTIAGIFVNANQRRSDTRVRRIA